MSSTNVLAQMAASGGDGQQADEVIVSDRVMRTPKYLYGRATGLAVMRLSWLEVRRLQHSAMHHVEDLTSMCWSETFYPEASCCARCFSRGDGVRSTGVQGVRPQG